jgi:hypothetical protein
MDCCPCGAPMEFSADGVHGVGCDEALARWRCDRKAVASLVARLEQDRSCVLCEQLAQALGYEVGVKPGAVEIDKPGYPLLSVYVHMDVLVDDLLQNGKAMR